MTYQVLYRTYRPNNFKSVVGQDVIVKTLKNALKNNKIAHAYLFCGPRGTGKTSIAKLFAKAINCEYYDDEACEKCANCKAIANNNHPDIIELDAASNNGVDEIREIIEKAQFAPVLGKYKVYIIDEVHMLTKQAFNALLKTLEEPPKHVVFILATTDPEKIIPTVLSRCQRFNFSKVSTVNMTARIEDILKNEHIEYEKEAILALVKLADGGMRDALSMLEQCLAYDDKLSYDVVRMVYGLATSEEKINIIKLFHDEDSSKVIDKLEKMDRDGIDIKRLCIDIIDILKEAVVYHNQKNVGEMKLEYITSANAQELNNYLTTDIMLDDIDYLIEVINRQRQSQTSLFYLELAVLKTTKLHKEVKEENPSKVVEEVKVEEEIMPEEDIQEEIIELKEEPIIPQKEENKKAENHRKEDEIEKDITVSDDVLLSILMNANREEKTNDSIIFNRIGLYELEVDKRKFYQALHDAELFASSKDMIIVCGSDIQDKMINNPSFNKELYFFIEEEFGIDKMIFAIDKPRRDKIVKLYIDARNHPENYNIDIDIKIERYKKEEKIVKSKEEELFEAFGDKLKVEE